MILVFYQAISIVPIYELVLRERMFCMQQLIYSFSNVLNLLQHFLL